MTFDTLLDAIETLSLEKQRDLLVLLQHRLREARREEIARNANAAEALFADGALPLGSVDDFLVDLETNPL